MNKKVSKLPGLVGSISSNITEGIGARATPMILANDLIHMALSGEPGTPTDDGSYQFSTSGYVTAGVQFNEVPAAIIRRLSIIDAPNDEDPPTNPDGILLGDAIFEDVNEYATFGIRRTDGDMISRVSPVYVIYDGV